MGSLLYFRFGMCGGIGQVMKPEPRTARRYTVDSKCELAAHNLTIDSSTGGFGVLRWSLAGEAYSVSGVGACRGCGFGFGGWDVGFKAE